MQISDNTDERRGDLSICEPFVNVIRYYWSERHSGKEFLLLLLLLLLLPIIIIAIIKNQDYTDHSRVEIGYNTGKITGDPKRLWKSPSIKLVWKTHKNVNTTSDSNKSIPSDHRVKSKESEKKDKSLNQDSEMKITMEYESNSNTNCH